MTTYEYHYEHGEANFGKPIDTEVAARAWFGALSGRIGPVLPVLSRVWDNVIRRDSRFASWEFAAGGRGVVAAIRVNE